MKWVPVALILVVVTLIGGSLYYAQNRIVTFTSYEMILDDNVSVFDAFNDLLGKALLSNVLNTCVGGKEAIGLEINFSARADIRRIGEDEERFFRKATLTIKGKCPLFGRR